MRKCWAMILVVLSIQLTAQQKADTLSISFRDFPLELILDSITYKTGYQFSYNADLIPSGSLYSLRKRSVKLDQLLKELFVGTGIEFSLLDDQVILRKTKTINNSAKNNLVDNGVTVTGWVREYDSKLPIVGVNVFINGTTIGTVTDQYGNYKMVGLKPGRHELVFSHVSYQLASYSLNGENGQSYAVNGLLDFKVETLQFIEVVSEPLVSEDDWPKYYKRFSKEFFGTSPNGSRCEIINPDALQFSYNDDQDILKAEATQPLIIFNNALGYKITYDLESFIQEQDKTSYYGKGRFENLTASAGRIRKRWRRNRLRSFRGSVFHFMRSLINDQLEEEGFKVYSIREVGDIYINKLNPINREKLIKPGENDHQWLLDFNGYLVILYERELESTQYFREVQEKKAGGEGLAGTNSFNRGHPDVQKTIIELNRTFVTIDHNGQIIEPLGLSTIGYWAWERMAELVPANYNPKQDNL